MKIALTGATGSIGSALHHRLDRGGHQVVRLIRREPAPGSTDVRWDPQARDLELPALEGFS